MELAVIIKKCQKGDRKAQKKLYDLFSATLFGICLRYANDSSQAEDILQESFIKIFSKISTFQSKGSLEGWMKRITTNTAIDFVRKKSKMQNVDESFIDFHHSVEVPDNIDLEQILEIIQNMPNGYRIVFNMYAIEGYSHKEIAVKLNISEGTSKSQLSRARKLIQEKIEKLNTTK